MKYEEPNMWIVLMDDEIPVTLQSGSADDEFENGEYEDW